MPGTADQEMMRRLMERLDDVTDIKVQMSILAQQMQTLAKSQEELTQVMKGNGKPGLADRVKDLESVTLNHPMTCPLRIQVMQMAEQIDAMRKEKEESREEEREKVIEQRKTRSSLFVSLVMLVVSTLVNIALYFSNLK